MNIIKRVNEEDIKDICCLNELCGSKKLELLHCHNNEETYLCVDCGEKFIVCCSEDEEMDFEPMGKSCPSRRNMEGWN